MPDNLRILIVEDERDTARAVRRFLEFRGHDVEVARNGSSAIKKAADLEPQIAICDYKIEGEQDGVDVAKQLHARYDIPVVMVTGHRLSEARKKARNIKAHISAFRRKPISLSDLASLVENLTPSH